MISTLTQEELQELGQRLKAVGQAMKPHLDGVIHGLACEVLEGKSHVFEIIRKDGLVKMKQKWVIEGEEVREKSARVFGVSYEDQTFISKSGRKLCPLLC